MLLQAICGKELGQGGALLVNHVLADLYFSRGPIASIHLGLPLAIMSQADWGQDVLRASLQQLQPPLSQDEIPPADCVSDSVMQAHELSPVAARMTWERILLAFPGVERLFLQETGDYNSMTLPRLRDPPQSAVLQLARAVWLQNSRASQSQEQWCHCLAVISTL